jgi:hypothetical protein
MFGADSSLTEAIAYAREHGGGAVAVSSQSSAASAVADGADVVALGGFSGRESEVSAVWLADRVADRTIRWVLAGGEDGGMRSDGRTGSGTVMAAVAGTCTPVASVDGLYDCGAASATLAAG